MSETSNIAILEKKEYSFEQKERLARRIQKLKKPKYYTDIEQIITKFNPELDITTNPSGKFMYFQDLNVDTYFALEKYVKRIIKQKTLSETSDSVQYSSDFTLSQNTDNDDPFNGGSSKLKYSNREKNLIKRKIYDSEINKDRFDTSELSEGKSHDDAKIKVIPTPQVVSDASLHGEINNVFVKRKNDRLKIKKSYV